MIMNDLNIEAIQLTDLKNAIYTLNTELTQIFLFLLVNWGATVVQS